MMKLLVIGSKGFIGSHLTDFMSTQKDYEVWGCDIVNDYLAKNYCKIDALNTKFEVMFDIHRFDVCVNCSGSANVGDSLIDPMKDYELNTFNVFKIIEAIRKYSPHCKFLNISSAAVYGNPANLPVKETSDLLPISPYGIHKLQSEQICEEFNRFYNISTCSVRIFSAYGNRLKKQLFWDIAQKLNQPNKVTLYGTGNESRDFIHVDDIVRAIELIITKSDFNASIYNIANGVEITIKEVAKKMENLLGYTNKISFGGQQRLGDPLNWRAEISALTALGYQQKVTIDEGLNKYVSWLREEELV